MNAYDYSIWDASGREIPLKDYEGKVMLIVNTATACGFTPQYEDIENLYEDYHDKGLEIIDIPCNQFGAQAPGTDEEIHEFCKLHYNTKYLQARKSDVNGPDALPLYTYLKSQKGFEGFGDYPRSDFMREKMQVLNPDYEDNPDIKWNFTKFVIDRKGDVVARFEPTVSMSEVVECVEGLL